MGQALYRKYRPKNFSEAVGQESITATLDEAVKSGRISHAYLFAGPRGVGKTSIARILAHLANNLPYTDDNFHMDIIEIDAASNRRIDEIRDLREKVHITPTSAKYKVYIIDEVHMLTKEAFNALLKTLEEPPEHCIFILATTEAHKLPETIISRTQRFNFKPISKKAARQQLDKIARAERIKIDPEALDLLAEFGDGSLRDIIGLLDQLSTATKQITEKEVRELLGIPSIKAIDELIKAISQGNAAKALETLDLLKDQAASPATVAKALSQSLRQRLLAQTDNGQWLTSLLKELVDVSSSANPQDTLELAVLEAAAKNQDYPSNRDRPSKNDSSQNGFHPEVRMPKKADFNQQQTAALTSEHWSELLKRVKVDAPALYTALRLAEPIIIEDMLVLAFPFPLHQKKAQEARHSRLIAEALEGIIGAKLIIKCTVDKELTGSREILLPDEDEAVLDVKTISNIFGSAEVLES